MEPQDDDSVYAVIHAKLARLSAEAAIPPPWYEAWTRLGLAATDEERLAVYQAVRDAGSLPEAAGLYLVSWQIDALALADADEALGALEDQLEAIERAHGLGEDERWPPGEEPSEYAALQRQLHDAWDVLYAAKLDEFGEPALARLYRTDPERFEQLQEAGRQFFHGSEAGDDEEATEWLDELLDAVSACVEADSPMGPLRLRSWEEEGFWEIWIYPTAVEVVGGVHDGAVVVPGFRLDLEQLREVFDSLVAFGWNALGLNDTEGPHIYVEGVVEGREVYLQVLAYAPEDEEPGLKVDLTKRPRPPE
jgi:hypothetical protein